MKRAALEANGWELIVVWEHDDIAEAVRTIRQRVKEHVAARG